MKVKISSPAWALLLWQKLLLAAAEMRAPIPAHAEEQVPLIMKNWGGKGRNSVFLGSASCRGKEKPAIH